MPKQQPTIRVTTRQCGEFRWYDWTLVLPFSEHGEAQEFYLGQDAKFLSRGLGMNGTYFRNLVCDRLDQEHALIDPRLLEVREAMAEEIIEQLGGEKQVRSAEPWELCAQ